MEFCRALLFLLLTLLPGYELIAQADNPAPESSSTLGLNGWFSIGTTVFDLTPENDVNLRLNANFFGGLYLNDWLSANVGAGLRVNDGYYVIPFYGGLRYADQQKEVSPHLLLSGGFVTNPDLGSQEGPWIALVQAGIQFNKNSLGMTFFLAYENLPLYEQRPLGGWFLGSQGYTRTGDLRVSRRYQWLSIGFTLSF